MKTPISKAEFEVMDALWREHPLGAAEITDRLADRTGWSSKTVKTLLSRLVEKGALAHESEGRRYLYRPLISRDHYAGAETANLADKLFGGRAAPMVAHLADTRGLTAEDISELETILKEIKNERD